MLSCRTAALKREQARSWSGMPPGDPRFQPVVAAGPDGRLRRIVGIELGKCVAVGRFPLLVGFEVGEADEWVGLHEFASHAHLDDEVEVGEIGDGQRRAVVAVIAVEEVVHPRALPGVYRIDRVALRLRHAVVEPHLGDGPDSHGGPACR